MTGQLRILSQTTIFTLELRNMSKFKFKHQKKFPREHRITKFDANIIFIMKHG